MASYSKKARKADPSYKKNKSSAADTQLTIPLIRSGSGNINALQVDAPRIASTYGHRLYRQCGNYRLKIDLHTSSGDVAGFQVVTLANNWYVKRAIQTARDMHDQAMTEERAVAGQSRWYDFRIGVGSIISGVSDDMLPHVGTDPTNMAGLAFQGDWDYSSVQDSAGNVKAFRLTGATSVSQYNIFSEYDLMGNADRSPVSSAGLGGYDGVTADLESEDINRLLRQGENPPYNAEDLPDQVFVSQGHLFRAGGLSRESTGFFDAPLGLVWLVPDSVASPNPLVMLEFAKGTYKGVRMDAY